MQLFGTKMGLVDDVSKNVKLMALIWHVEILHILRSARRKSGSHFTSYPWAAVDLRNRGRN